MLWNRSGGPDPAHSRVVVQRLDQDALLGSEVAVLLEP